MPPVLIGRFESGSPEWHAARAKGIGGSEVAPILGLSPFESRFSLWHRKAGAVGPVEETPEMEWGRRLEPVILRKFAEEHPALVVRPEKGTYHHADRPWQIANPDGEAAPRDRVNAPDFSDDEIELVEAKTARYDDAWGEPGTDEVPIYYRVQAIWYCDVLGARRCHMPVLVGGSDYREYVVTYDADEAAEIRSKVAEFLATLERHERPDIDDHTATYQVIRELHPDIDPVDHHLDGDLARRFIAAKANEKRAKADAQHATSLVADAMGCAARAIWDDTTIARRQARDGGTPYLVAARGIDRLASTLTQEQAA